MATQALRKAGDFMIPSVFDDFFKPWNEWLTTGNNTIGRSFNMPAVNVEEQTDEYIMTVAAPGMKKEDFTIELYENILTISSEKEVNKEDEDAKYTRKEYNYTSFSRSFTMPDEVNCEAIVATYDNGILKVSVPKKESRKQAVISKKISIK
jgi:HSP20 family protein